VRIRLIRHPRPLVAAGICYGRSDLRLAEDATECAARLRNQLPADLPLFTSPLRRCLALAQSLHASPVIDERLIEMNFGAWEMRAWDDIPRREVDAWSAAPFDYVPPGGEPVAAVRARVRSFLEARRAEASKDIVVVTHAGVMKLIAAEGTALAENDWLTMTFDYGDIYVVDVQPD
jgi:alpha-ribazole phosphatase